MAYNCGCGGIGLDYVELGWSRILLSKWKWMSLSWELGVIFRWYFSSIYIELGMNIHLIYNRGKNIFSALITSGIDRYCLPSINPWFIPLAIVLTGSLHYQYINGLVLERCYSIAKALELHLFCTNLSISCILNISRVSCQKGPTCHAYAWQIGPFWQDTLDIRRQIWI